MTRIGMPAVTLIAMVWLGAQAEAQAPCPELVRLRNAATETWKEAMRAPPSERCGALYRASSAAEATLNYANSNRFDPIPQISSNVEISGSLIQ
jgi:hypothetical protein